MKWNTPLWFLPCLYVVEVFAIIIERILVHSSYISEKNMLRIGLSTCFAIIGFILFGQIYTDVFLPFHIETALILIMYFELGVFFQDFIKKEMHCDHKIMQLLVCLILFGVGFILVKANWLADIRLMKFGNSEILYVSASITNCLALILSSFLIEKSRMLEYIGRNTMKTLVMHKFPVLFFQTIVPITANVFAKKSETLLGCLIALIIALLCVYMCVIIGNYSEKMIPWLYGRNMGKKRT